MTKTITIVVNMTRNDDANANPALTLTTKTKNRWTSLKLPQRIVHLKPVKTAVKLNLMDRPLSWAGMTRKKKVKLKIRGLVSSLMIARRCIGLTSVAGAMDGGSDGASHD